MAVVEFSALDSGIKRVYSRGMIEERNPITEWGNAIKHEAGGLTMAVILLAFICAMIAPIFGPIIKHLKRRDYVMYKDYEARAERDMKRIRPFLWVIALISWGIYFYCKAHYP